MTDKDIRQTDCTFNRRLHRHATRMWSEALWTMYPTRRSREADGISESNTRYGTSLGCMVNTCEQLINLVIRNKPKLLKGLGQKASGMGVLFTSQYTRSTNPPGERLNLNTLCHHCGTWKPLPSAQNIGQGNRKKNPMDEGSRMVQKAKASR